MFREGFVFIMRFIRGT